MHALAHARRHQRNAALVRDPRDLLERIIPGMQRQIERAVVHR
jgi:hypothetical protein